MSSLKDLASLIMIPSLVKDGRLDTVKPLGNGIIHPDATGNNDGTDGSTPSEGNFTFSRGSNLAATRVDVNGLIEKGRENLFTQSNNFASWGANNIGLTSGQVGYDGSNDAWLLNENSATSEHKIIQNDPSVGGVTTISIYAKANTRDWLWIRGVVSSSSVYAWFDLSNGVLGSTLGNIIDHNIESVGNGWYRCSVTLNHTAAFEQYIGLTNADLTSLYAGNGTGSIYIQDAQLEQGLVATDYIETTTTAVYEGITDNLPRLDYSGGASCPSLLLEPSRTNLVAFSEYFGSYAKLTSDATAVPVVTDNYAESPEGVQNAARVVLTKPSGSNDYAIIREAKSVSKTSGEKMSQSVYLKATDATQVGKIVDVYTYDGSYLVVENHALTSDWKRIEVTHTASIPTSYTEMVIGKARASAGGTTLANMATDFLVYGHQFETNASYATSYIPTYGASASRAQDFNYLLSISDLLNNSEGTIFLEVQGLYNGGDSRRLTISDGTSSNRVTIELDEIASRIRAYIVGGGANDGNLDIDGIDQTGNLKIAVTYNGSALKMSVNGSTPSLLATSVVTSGMNRMQFSTAGASTNKMFGKVKQALVFKTALTDAECIALTTI